MRNFARNALVGLSLAAGLSFAGAALAQQPIVVNFSHVVALVDADGDPATPGLRLPTLAEIAAALTGKINTGASGGFLAIAEGQKQRDQQAKIGQQTD